MQASGQMQRISELAVLHKALYSFLSQNNLWVVDCMCSDDVIAELGLSGLQLFWEKQPLHWSKQFTCFAIGSIQAV